MKVPFTNVNRWIGLLVSLFASATFGFATAFNVFALAVKDTFNYTQSQLELVSSIGLSGAALSFLGPILTAKCGYKATYIFCLLTAAPSSVFLYVGTIYKAFFTDWPSIIGLFFFITNMMTIFAMFHVMQIGSGNFAKMHFGKIVGLYTGLVGFGKIFFATIYEVFFKGNIGGLFLATGVLWLVLIGLCLIFHRPLPTDEEEAQELIVESTEWQQRAKENGTKSDSSRYERAVSGMWKSPYFHLMFWASGAMYGAFFTMLDNITLIGQSAGLKNPLILVYIFSMAMVFSRIAFGALYDMFLTELVGFLLCFLCYGFFMVAMIIGMVWFNDVSVIIITVLIGLSVAGAQTIPLTLISIRFGRKKLSAVATVHCSLMVAVAYLLQLLIGMFYDHETHSGIQNICINSTYFTWGAKLYEQINGLPMGSPLSPVLTEIYMANLEKQALLSSPIQPLCWYRKVDDVFTILNKQDDPAALLQHLNSQHSQIKFTMETETENKLPFLDVHIEKTEQNLTTNVYRKPTHTDQYVNFQSAHPSQVKTGIIATLTRRAKNLCSPDNIKDELDHIRKTFTDYNNYPREVVNKTIAKTLRHIGNNPDTQPKDRSPILVTLPYDGRKSHQIRRILKRQANIDSIFLTNPSLKSKLNATGRQKTPNPPQPKGTIYKINCDCRESYIGETCRPLGVRVKEHRTSSEKQDSKSAISDHLQANPSHTIDWDNIEILSRNQTDMRRRKLQEALEIKRFSPQLNRDQGLFIPRAYDSLIRLEDDRQSNRQ